MAGKKGKIPPLEQAEPDKAADVLISSLSDPTARFSALAEMCGMPPKLARAMINRMKRNHPDAVREAKEIGDRETLREINRKIGMVLEYIDDYSLANANARDLAITLSILIEKKQLLEGKPTAIVTVEERKHLTVLLSDAIKEAKRRGITIDQTPDEPTRLMDPETPHRKKINQTLRRVPEPPVDVTLE